MNKKCSKTCVIEISKNVFSRLTKGREIYVFFMPAYSDFFKEDEKIGKSRIE